MGGRRLKVEQKGAFWFEVAITETTLEQMAKQLEDFGYVVIRPEEVQNEGIDDDDV